MKKTAQSSKKSKDLALQKKAENNITIVTCSIVIYAMILFMIHSMFSFESTRSGADTIRRALIYAGIIAGLLIASYAAYKSNKSLVKYSLMCFFVSISSAGILLGAPWGMRATAIALVAGFVLVCVYAVLTDKKIYYSSKKVRIVFKTIIAILYTALLAMVVYGIAANYIAINNSIKNHLNIQNRPEKTETVNTVTNSEDLTENVTEEYVLPTELVTE